MNPRELLERSHHLLEAGRHQEALDAVEQALALEPALESGHNHAGWILLSSPSRDEAALTRAIAHFEAAIEHDPTDGLAMRNLGEALLVAGRADEAVQRLEKLAAENALWAAQPSLWLGYYFTRVREDLPRALAHLEKATRMGGWWAPALEKYGWALERAGRHDDAYEQYGRALRCQDAERDPALAHGCRSNYEEHRGWLRHALSSLRRAIVHEERKPRGRIEMLLTAEPPMCEELRRRGLYYPAFADERVWIEREIAEGREGLGLDPYQQAPTFAACARQLEKARREVAGIADVAAALAAARDCVVARELPAARAGIAFSVDLAAVPEVGRRRVERALRAFGRLHLLLYLDELGRERPAAGPLAPIQQVLYERRYWEALAALWQLDPCVRVDSARFAEQAGERARLDGRRPEAQDFLAFALEGYRIFASWASSGAEGLGRMADVKRVENRLAR